MSSNSRTDVTGSGKTHHTALRVLEPVNNAPAITCAFRQSAAAMAAMRLTKCKNDSEMGMLVLSIVEVDSVSATA